MPASIDLHVDLRERGELARQIYRQIRSAILDGRLRRGDRVPPSRELARRLDVSRNTVSLAYAWLSAEGLLSGHRGAGSFVEGEARLRPLRRPGAPIHARSVWLNVAAPARRLAVPAYDFAVGVPDVSLFPFDAWRRLLARQVRAELASSEYGDPAGHPNLRRAIARHIAVSRGVRADAEDVLVTNGAQGAFDLVARVLLEPGASVAIEEPGYPPVRLLFKSCGARLTLVPVDAEGLDVGRLPDDAQLIYITPSHQFPLGMPMSPARRVALLEWAERRNAVILEDDYDSEFRFGGRPLETLQAMDRSGRVLYVGSFSKVLLPALRIGFLVAPPSLRTTLRAAAYVTSWFPPWPAQGTLASLIETGLLARHVRRARRQYAARHETILRSLERDFAGWVEPVAPVTGLHLAAPLRSGGVRLEAAVVGRARDLGVACDRLSAYCAAAPRAGIVLGYGALPDARIEEGLRRLRRSFAAAERLR